MEKNRSPVPRKDGSHGRLMRKNPRCSADDSGNMTACSGKHCRSCTAGMLADCVAICCCPCAVVSFLALACFKAPLMMGKRCLGFRGKRVQKSERKRRREEIVTEGVREDIDENSVQAGIEEGSAEMGTGCEDGLQREDLSANSEAEKLWLDLYQIGHLGFGRVSFTGTQCQGKDD
ncbi:hypothetical protein NMG60_11006654 [Bertholletia excelsa]